MPGKFLVFQLPAELNAAGAGHFDIEDDHGGLFVARQVQHVITDAGLDHLVTSPEGIFQNLTKKIVVIDNQDGLGRQGHSDPPKSLHLQQLRHLKHVQPTVNSRQRA
jgi:hypothetical protein